MPLLDRSQMHVTTTSNRFLQNSTGFQFAREWCSRLWCWYGRRHCSRLSLRTLRSCCLFFRSCVRQHLRSTSTGLLQVPRTRTTIGRRSFAVAGPSLWNSLPAALRRPEMTLHTFRRQLKAYLFHIWYAGEQKEYSPPRCCGVFMILAPDKKLLTYLLSDWLAACRPSLSSDNVV